MRRRTRLNRERGTSGGGPQKVVSFHAIDAFMTPQQREQTTKLAALDAGQQQAVRGWMTYYGYSFEDAYFLVSRENHFPPRRRA